MQTALWCVAALASLTVIAVPYLPLREPVVGWTSLVVLTVLALATARQDVWAQLRTDGRHGQEMIDLDEVSLVLLLVLLEPHWALLVAISTYGVALVSARPNPLKTVFNIASRTATIGLAAWLTARYVDAPLDQLDPWSALVIAGAVLVHVVLNFLAVKIVVAAVTGSTIRRTIRTTAGLNMVMWVGNASLGLAAAALWLAHPALIIVAAALATVVRRAYHTVVVVNGLAGELEVERDRLRGLVDGARDGIIQLDASGAVEVWNPAVEHLTGVPAEAAHGVQVDELLADRVDVQHGADTLADAVRGSAPPGDQLLSVQADGVERSLIARHSIRHDPDGEVLGDIIQLHDRTAMERVARIEHDFLSRVTHELLTPLTVIRGVSQTVLAHSERLTPDVRQDLLERLSHNATQMEALVNDLLAVEATRQLQAAQPVEPLELWSLVQAAVSAERQLWDGRTIELHGDEVEVPVQPASFMTIVRHLVRNALTYSPADAPVSISLEADDPDTAVLVVRDHGRGIPPDRLEEMFAPFTRMEDPLVMETRGIGVGLYLVRQLVADMDGTVRATSRPGEGSRFEVRLPATRR